MRRREDLTVKLRPWIVVKRTRVNSAAPLSSQNGKPHLPKHWCAKDEAEAAVRRREWLRFLVEFESVVNRFDPHW